MSKIFLTTFINNRPDVCFDLSRSIDLHKISTAHTNEEAVAGCTTGLINLDEFVTWRAKHFGLFLHLTTQITAFNSPRHFRDEQIKGPFRLMVHDHFFESRNGGTVMTDKFVFRSPLGLLGLAVDRLVMKRYLTSLLTNRNATIKEFAESDCYTTVLS